MECLAGGLAALDGVDEFIELVGIAIIGKMVALQCTGEHGALDCGLRNATLDHY